MGWRKVASDVRLLLREVDLIAEAQRHPLRHGGHTPGLALAALWICIQQPNVRHYNRLGRDQK